MVALSISRITNSLTVRLQLSRALIATKPPDEVPVHEQFDLARPDERYGAGIKSAKFFASHDEGARWRAGHGRPGRLAPLPGFSFRPARWRAVPARRKWRPCPGADRCARPGRSGCLGRARG